MQLNMAKRPSFLNIRPMIEIPNDEKEMMGDDDDQSPEMEHDGLPLPLNNAVAPILVANDVGQPLEFPHYTAIGMPTIDPNLNPELPTAQLVPILQAQLNEARERQMANQEQHNQTVKEMQKEINIYKAQLLSYQIALEKCQSEIKELKEQVAKLTNIEGGHDKNE